MNRYTAGGRSKASATTLCQKCLKRGHYSYECSAAQQDRPYISRPSRTQQLLNPKLVPKLTEAAPETLPDKTSQATSSDQKRKRAAEKSAPPRKRSRSSSYSSDSDSVSTISTNRSRSPSWSPPNRGSGSVEHTKTSVQDQDLSTGRHARSRSPFREKPRVRQPSTEANVAQRRNDGARSLSRSLSPYSKRLGLKRR